LGAPLLCSTAAVNEPLVVASHSRRLAARLAAAGSQVELLELPWAEHAFDFVFDGWGGQCARPLLLDFLRRQLG
jgi:acetyl esterase/lipase